MTCVIVDLVFSLGIWTTTLTVNCLALVSITDLVKSITRFVLKFQKAELDAVQSRSAESTEADGELLQRLEQKEEEVKLYKGKYEDCSRQLAQSVSL